MPRRLLKYWSGSRCCGFWRWPRREAQRRYPQRSRPSEQRRPAPKSTQPSTARGLPQYFNSLLDRFIQYHSELPMNFSPPQNWTLFLSALRRRSLSSMNRSRSCRWEEGEKTAIRSTQGVKRSVIQQSCRLSAQHLLTLNPQDNGSWDRLVQAQFGLRDHAAVKKSLNSGGNR